jgi:tRNA pseudouridine38-40 synthase
LSKFSHYYIIRIEFLGFRYHGWQKQLKLKTIQGMVDKTIEFITGHTDFRTLGCGRTDARVSADDFVLELFLTESLEPIAFLSLLNKNLPSDIRALSVTETTAEFNIIQHAKVKEYHYYFSFGEKPHPFSAPLITDLGEDMDIDSMIAAAILFQGVHNFRRFTADAKLDKDFTRYVLKIKSKGFMRYQIRLIMGGLELLGKGKLTVSQLEDYLTHAEGEAMNNIVPGSGLILHRVLLE